MNTMSPASAPDRIELPGGYYLVRGTKYNYSLYGPVAGRRVNYVGRIESRIVADFAAAMTAPQPTATASSGANMQLAEANARKIVAKAEELARVGGYACIDYPVAVAYLAVHAELEQLRASPPANSALVAEVERLTEAMERIVQWADAYPLDIFPEPDFKKAHEVLTANGMTLDAISASCMRHVVEGVGKISRQALAGADMGGK